MFFFSRFLNCINGTKSRKALQINPYHANTVIYFIIPCILYWPICSQCIFSLLSENIRKSYGFLIFSGGREKMHSEQMG